MKTTTKTTAAAALIAALLLTGCSNTDVFSGGTKAEPTTAAEPTPTVIPGDENGDGKLSEREKELLAKKAPRDYTMNDGTVVSIDPTQPMPTEVVEELTAEILPTATGIKSAQDYDVDPALATILEFANRAETETGIGVIVLIHMPVSSGGKMWGSMASGKKAGPLTAMRDKTAMIEQATRWVEPRGYAVLVAG